jgi:hypothetical protein
VTQKAVIGCVRFAPGYDPHAARIRLERLLGTVEWAVPGLPPAAILCVRRLRARTGSPGAISAILERLARGAVRPAREFVPAAAEAVWFADNAERLACLARAALVGEVAQQWWWETVRSAPTTTRSAVREWLTAPADAPAAWRVLAGWGRARDFAAALEPNEAVALIRAMGDAFGVRPDLAPARDPFESAAEVQIVPEAGALPLGPQRMALVMGLLLARVPHLARAIVSAARVPTPQRTESATGPSVRSEAIERRLAPRTVDRSASRAEGEPEQIGGAVEAAPPSAPDGPRTEPVPEQARVVPGGAGDRSEPPEPAGEPSDEPSDGLIDESPAAPSRFAPSDPQPVPVDSDEDEGHAIVERPDRGPPTMHPAERPAERSEEIGPRPSVEVEEDRPAERPPVPERIDTEFGGLLYLVNVGLSLTLYPDFTEPTRPGIALALWDWLALLGRRWMGQPFVDDPLDGLLAALAGRSAAAEPGAGSGPPSYWRLPEPWRPWVGTPEPEGWSGLAEWIDWLAPVIAARLASALGRADADAAPQWLLRRRAAVLVAPAHLDVVMPLADLPVEIRLAGLDRDPGWLPASGATVRFHYESHGAAGERLR